MEELEGLESFAVMAEGLPKLFQKLSDEDSNYLQSLVAGCLNSSA